MRQIATIAAWGILWLASYGLSRADGPDLAELRVKLADSAIPVDERARLALEAAAGLDQQAQQMRAAADLRSKWSDAVGLLDGFVTANPDIESASVIRFQAGVYRWAEGRNAADRFELTPGDLKLRDLARQSLDDSIRRLRSISIKPDESASVLGQNVRFRLAQAIADRCELVSDEDPNRTKSEREALGLLDSSLTAPGLRPFASLLRGELLNRLGLFGQTQIELEHADLLIPPLTVEDILEVRVGSLLGRRFFDEASALIDGSKARDPFKGWLAVRVALARRKEKPPGTEQKEIDATAFRLAERFRGSNQIEARRALMELARTIDEPGDDAVPDWWDLLAEGHLRLGDSVRAGRLEGKGADRAQAAGLSEKAAALRYKSGAYLYEAGRFAEADRRLSQVLELPGASQDLKSRAGMLRALARGRAVATHEAGSSQAAYLASLEAQIRDFPNEKSSGEARWLLGQIRLSAGRPEEMIRLCSGISHGHSRWLEAQLLIADQLRQAVEDQCINGDSVAIASKMELARKSLQSALNEALEGFEAATLTLQSVKLESTPVAGRPALALEACDRLIKRAARPEQHQTARVYRIVALAQSGRFAEAEQAARAEARNEDLSHVIPVLRLLDRSACVTESELSRRRFGLIARVLTTRMVDHLDAFPPPRRDEVRLHNARAILFAGDQVGAKKEIAAWGGPTEAIDDELIRELADTYLRLDAFVLAIDAERYRASRLSPGSLPWFETRYGMALAYFRAGRTKEARQLIDSTAILHPELGGGELKVKFERLRQRVAQD